MSAEKGLKAEPIIEDIGEVGTENNPQGSIFKKGEIEEIAKSEEKKTNKRRGIFRITIRRLPEIIGGTIGDIFEQTYNFVNDNDPAGQSNQEVIIDDDEDEKA